MFTVGVRDHMMIAHSFNGEIFGPAQKLHGATYIVDVEFKAAELNPLGIVVDIGLARQKLTHVLEQLNYKNLDELDVFKGKNTTTEFLAYYIYQQFDACINSGELGEASNISNIKVTLGESHVAWACYEKDR